HHCFCRLKLGWPQGAVSALRYVHHDFKRTPVLKVQSPDDLIPSERLVKVPVYDGVPIPAAVRDVVPMNDGSAVRVAACGLLPQVIPQGGVWPVWRIGPVNRTISFPTRQEKLPIGGE